MARSFVAVHSRKVAFPVSRRKGNVGVADSYRIQLDLNLVRKRFSKEDILNDKVFIERPNYSVSVLPRLRAQLILAQIGTIAFTEASNVQPMASPPFAVMG